jgi:hypothetical protein
MVKTLLEKIAELDNRDFLTIRQLNRLFKLKHQYNLSVIRRGKKPLAKPLCYREKGILTWK